VSLENDELLDVSRSRQLELEDLRDDEVGGGV